MSAITSSKGKIPLAHGNSIAARLMFGLKGGCDRIEIAGSLRRRRPFVGDIELLAIPIANHDLLGQPLEHTQLDERVASMIDRGELAPGPRNGSKWKTLQICEVPGLLLDLFIVTPATWGREMLVRTGPAEFSHRMVTPRTQGGWLPGDFRFDGNRLWRAKAGGMQVLDTPEEQDVFAALGLAYIEPWDRNERSYD